MKFPEIARQLKGIPYTHTEMGRCLYDHILRVRPNRCLELGFAHGVASCYMAAAFDELNSGAVVSVDLGDSVRSEPNLEGLLVQTGLEKYVEIHREKNSYTWFLKKEIEKNSRNYVCTPVYDFCFIDGPKNWTIDGFAFFLVDKLLKNSGWVIFDDYRWKYSEYSKDFLDGISIRGMSQDQAEVPNIEFVFQLLVMQHPDYGSFVIDEDWAWAQKGSSPEKHVHFRMTKSFKYRLLKMLRRLLRK